MENTLNLITVKSYQFERIKFIILFLKIIYTNYQITPFQKHANITNDHMHNQNVAQSYMSMKFPRYFTKINQS